jgi:hypothetical protein
MTYPMQASVNFSDQQLSLATYNDKSLYSQVGLSDPVGPVWRVPSLSYINNKHFMVILCQI